MWVGELFSRHLTAFTTAAALGELVIAAIAGAALYKEDDSELDEFESESDLLEP
jgi:hypothetical protein